MEKNRDPKFECLPTVRLSSYRRYCWLVRLSQLPSIFGEERGPLVLPFLEIWTPKQGVPVTFGKEKYFFFAFLGVLNVSKTFNFCRYLKVFYGKKIFFFIPRPQVWVPPPGPSFELSSIFLARPTKPAAVDFSVKHGPPTPSPSRDIDPQTGGVSHFSEKFRQHQV